MSTAMKSTLVATWLPPDGYEYLRADFEEENAQLPDPALSSIAVVIDTETSELVGFIAAVSVVHCEFLKVRPEYQHSNALDLLLQKIQEPFREANGSFYVFVPDDRIQHLVERNGMKMLPYRIAFKSFAET